MQFTIRQNGGTALRTFVATNFAEFKEAIAPDWNSGSVSGLKSFFYDRYQVKALIGANTLVCRAA